VSSGKRWKVVASAICWTLAVVSALLAAAVFASGSVLCQGDRPEGCTPQTFALVVGVVSALGFGAAGAALHKPSSKPQPRRPWEYPR
jgi:hypothetical protein